jgi:hypothetical protein
VLPTILVVCRTKLAIVLKSTKAGSLPQQGKRRRGKENTKRLFTTFFSPPVRYLHQSSLLRFCYKVICAQMRTHLASLDAPRRRRRCRHAPTRKPDQVRSAFSGSSSRSDLILQHFLKASLTVRSHPLIFHPTPLSLSIPLSNAP